MLSCNTVLNQIINDFNISQEYLAHSIGSSPRTVSRWIKQKVKPLPVFQEKIEKIELIDRKLKAVLKKESISKWLNSENTVLGGESPIKLLKNGKYDEILAAIAQLEEGVYI